MFVIGGGGCGCGGKRRDCRRRWREHDRQTRSSVYLGPTLCLRTRPLVGRSAAGALREAEARILPPSSSSLAAPLLHRTKMAPSSGLHNEGASRLNLPANYVSQLQEPREALIMFDQICARLHFPCGGRIECQLNELIRMTTPKSHLVQPAPPV